MECAICLAVCVDDDTLVAQPTMTPCTHKLCADCVAKIKASTQACPFCRQPYGKEFFKVTTRFGSEAFVARVPSRDDVYQVRALLISLGVNVRADVTDEPVRVDARTAITQIVIPPQPICPIPWAAMVVSTDRHLLAHVVWRALAGAVEGRQ